MFTTASSYSTEEPIAVIASFQCRVTPARAARGVEYGSSTDAALGPLS